MTSISQQPPLAPQASTNAAQTATQVHSPSPSISGTTSPLAAVPAPTARSYANATKKPFSPTIASDANTAPLAVGGPAPAQHGQSDSKSSANSNQIPPAVPTVNTPTIVNGNNVISQPAQGDHSRKPSVTISASGATGYIPNGGPVAGPQSRPNSIQFGSMNAGGSPGQGNVTLQNQSPSMLSVAPMNPRISSPQTSPTPIPPPAASGGRPPSSLQGQGNGPIFGSFGGDSGDRQIRPNHQGPMASGPQASHLRRESSQSAHGDMGNPGMQGGRGGYPPTAGRGGRGFSQQYPQPYSPSPNYRQVPNQPRGGPNMQPPFQPQSRPLGPQFQNSPSLAARSPAMANSHPATPQMPMSTPQLQAQHYGGYPQPHHMGPQAQGYLQYDPYYTYYGQQQGMPQPQMFMPQSPRPGYGMPHQAPQQPQAPFMQQQYSNPPPPQAAPLSRSSSQISANDRPTSAAGGQAGTPVVPPASGHTHTAARATSSPVPKANFVIPPRAKSQGIVIRDPNTHAVKTFEKQPASPARATPSPVKASTTPTPTPPPPHNRSESVSIKTDEEKKREMQAAVAKKIQADEAEAQKKKDEEAAENSRKEKEEAEAKDREEREAEAKVREAADAKAKLEAEEKEKQAKEEAEKAEAEKAKAAEEAKAAEDAKAAEEAKAAENAKAAEDARIAEETKIAEEAKASEAAKEAEKEEPKVSDEDAETERMIAEMEAEEKAREAKEEAYRLKKQAEKEEKARKEAEETAAYEANMKNAEREAEALEEEKERKRREEADGEQSKQGPGDIFASLKAREASTPTSNGSPAARTPAESGTATPVSDASMGPPLRSTSGGKQKPAALKLETKKPVEPPQPSAALQSLRSARFVTSLDGLEYPTPFLSPNPSLNQGAPPRKFKYNKEFLLQFQDVFKDKPSEDWDAKVRDTVGEPTDSARPQSARTPSMMGPRNPSNRPQIPPAFSMGSFGQPARQQPLPPGTTSEQRFAMSNAGAQTQRPGPTNNPFGQYGRPGLPMGGTGMSRDNSRSGMAPLVPASPRVGGASHRGGTRSGSKRDKGSTRKDEEQNKSMPLTAGLDLRPIQTSQSGWKPRSVGSAALAGPAPGGDGHIPPDIVQRKVKANLNKMTPDNFERIALQILDIAAQSKNETDGRTLRQVIQLTFEKATDEAHWATMYARFCKRMLESMSPDIKDESIRDKAGNVVVGGNLFRKYLLNRCQEEFERGWKVNLPDKPEGQSEEAVMLSDEYYIAAAAKRRGLGLVKFIGELFKLGMLTERIMHECVKKLLDFEGLPDEAEIESLTSLLKTIGANLDATDKGVPSMNAYFHRIEGMIDIPELPSRLKFMLMDIRDLRRSGWHTRGDAKGPMTLQQVREEALMKQREAEMEKMRQQSQRGGGGRMPMGRGDSRNFSGGYGQMPPPPDYSGKVGSDDLRRLGSKAPSRQVSNQPGGPVSFGPSLLGSRSGSGRKGLGPSMSRGGDDSGASSRTGTPPAQKEKEKKDDKDATSANAFSALANLESSERHEAASPPSVTSSPPQVMSRPAIERQRSRSPNTETDKDAVAGSITGPGTS